MFKEYCVLCCDAVDCVIYVRETLFAYVQSYYKLVVTIHLRRTAIYFVDPIAINWEIDKWLKLKNETNVSPYY